VGKENYLLGAVTQGGAPAVATDAMARRVARMEPGNEVAAYCSAEHGGGVEMGTCHFAASASLRFFEFSVVKSRPLSPFSPI
jgi:hypothetical protein